MIHRHTPIHRATRDATLLIGMQSAWLANLRTLCRYDSAAGLVLCKQVQAHLFDRHKQLLQCTQACTVVTVRPSIWIS